MTLTINVTAYCHCIAETEYVRVGIHTRTVCRVFWGIIHTRDKTKARYKC